MKKPGGDSARAGVATLKKRIMIYLAIAVALVLGNEPDLVHPLSYAIAWAECLPHARFVQVPPKSVDFELSAQAVRTHVSEFLASLNKETICL